MDKDNKKSIIAVLAAAVALVLIVVLCIVFFASGGGDVDNDDIAGKYEIRTIEGGGDGIISNDDLKQMQSLDLTMTLEAKDDGTATMDIFGQETGITYDTETMTMDIQGEEVQFSYRMGELKIEQNGSTLVFVK